MIDAEDTELGKGPRNSLQIRPQVARFFWRWSPLSDIPNYAETGADLGAERLEQPEPGQLVTWNVADHANLAENRDEGGIPCARSKDPRC